MSNILNLFSSVAGGGQSADPLFSSSQRRRELTDVLLQTKEVKNFKRLSLLLKIT